MLFVLIQLGKDLYALDAKDIVEILPMVQVKQIPQAPHGLVGAIRYRGGPLPVVDLSMLMLDVPVVPSLSTRIIVTHYTDSGPDKLLGLIAPKATDTMERDPTDFVDSGVANDAAVYLGPVVMTPRGLVQRVDVQSLLPPSVQKVLYREHADDPR